MLREQIFSLEEQVLYSWNNFLDYVQFILCTSYKLVLWHCARMILCETGPNLANNKGCPESRNFATPSEGEIAKVFGLNLLLNETRINASSSNISVLLLEWVWRKQKKWWNSCLAHVISVNWESLSSGLHWNEYEGTFGVIMITNLIFYHLTSIEMSSELVIWRVRREIHLWPLNLSVVFLGV